MSLIKFWKKSMKKMTWQDVALIKIAVVAFTLMIAKLWTPLLSLDWYWYGLIFLIMWLPLMYKFYLKK